jgi:hypothetical protein
VNHGLVWFVSELNDPGEVTGNEQQAALLRASCDHFRKARFQEAGISPSGYCPCARHKPIDHEQERNHRVHHSDLKEMSGTNHQQHLSKDKSGGQGQQHLASTEKRRLLGEYPDKHRDDRSGRY